MPGDIFATSAVKARWICSKGHGFTESAVVQCGAASDWRQNSGGSRACLSCVGEKLYGLVALGYGHKEIGRSGVVDLAMCLARSTEPGKQQLRPSESLMSSECRTLCRRNHAAIMGHSGSARARFTSSVQGGSTTPPGVTPWVARGIKKTTRLLVVDEGRRKIDMQIL